MADQRRRRTVDVDEEQLSVGEPKDHAAGVKAVAVSTKRSLQRMGPARTARTLLKLNQTDGFDCMSCAWPDPDPEHRHKAEFCENGAKAVAEEATTARATPRVLRQAPDRRPRRAQRALAGPAGPDHPPDDQAARGDPLRADRVGRGLRVIAAELNALDDPDQALFYTSGRTSNEAAFAYQLFVRAFGTNNLPDCSNMCHESTSVALRECIGIGKASVTLNDVYNAELIILAGQNPGTNHPRMLSALEIAKRRAPRS